MLNFYTTGSGDDHIIFIHGNSQSAGTWSGVITEEILSSYTLVTLDTPGHGNSFRSNIPETDYSIKGAALHLANLIRLFEQKNYLIVCTSLGTILFGEAIASLKNCKGAILIGSCIIDDKLTPTDILQPNPNAMVSFNENPTDDELERYLNEVIFDRNNAEARSRYKETFLNTDPVYRRILTENVSNGEYSDHIANIKQAAIPVAFVFGEGESIINTEYIEKISLKKWKDGSLFVKNAGHLVEIDQPVLLANIIAEFAAYCFK